MVSAVKEKTEINWESILIPETLERPVLKFDLSESTRKILCLSQRNLEDMVAIGKELRWVKQHLEHGLWERWVRDELYWHPSTAWRYMKIANAYEISCVTQDFDSQTFIQQVWGNVPSDKKKLSNEQVTIQLGKELKRLHARLFSVLSKLDFCQHWTPEVDSQVKSLARALSDLLEVRKANQKVQQ